MFSEFRYLLKLATPLLAAQTLVTATGVVDTLMAGRYRADDLAAVAVGNSFWMPLALLVSGLLIATTTRVSRLRGAGQHIDIAGVVQQGGWLALALSLCCSMLLLNTGPLLAWWKVDPDFSDISVRYLNAVALGFPALAIFGSLRAFHEGMGDTLPFLLSSLLAFLANIPLNYMLIHGVGIFPELGGEGCGWATAICMWLQVAMLVYITANSRHGREVGLFARLHGPDAGAIRAQLQLGMPISAAVFAEVSIFSAIALLLAPLGPVVVSGHQIALAISHIIFMIPLSFAHALTIRVGYYLGRGEQDRANAVIRLGLAFGVAMGVVSASLILMIREPLVGLFTTDTAVRGAAISLFVWMALYQIPDQIQIIANASLRAYHDTRRPMLLVLMAYWGLALPLGYMLGRTDWLMPPLAAAGFWIGLLAGLSCAALLLGARLWRVASRPVQV